VFLFPVPGRGRQGWQRDVQAFAQIDGGIVGGLVVGLRPQVQRVAGAAALEAMEEVLVEVGREAAADAGRRAVQRARAALLGTTGAVGVEAEQLQDGGHADGGANGGEVDRRPASGGRLAQRLFVLGLA